MTKSPLLSILTVNKNDNYHEDQLQRTKFILNYLIYSLKKMDALNKVEYIVVDWGSKEPLSNYFYKEISTCPAIKFINVPLEETQKCKLSFDVSKAQNIGIKNCSGEHIMITSPDQFLPLSIFSNLLSLLEKPEIFGINGNEYKLVPRKNLEDQYFIFENDMEKIDTYLKHLCHSMLISHELQMNDGSGAGGNLLKKKQWLQIGGIKDSDTHNRGQDHVIFQEISSICTHIDTASFGSFLLKLPRTKLGFRKGKMKKIKNPLDYLEFKRDDSIINLNNIEIVNNLNLPKKKLDFNTQPFLEDKDSLTVLETIKTIFECSIFTVFSGISLKSQDIKFVLELKKIIKFNKFKNIVFDQSQSMRFLTYIAKSFPDMTFLVFIDPEKNTPLEIVKFRNAIATRAKFNQHYGHITVKEFNEFTFKSLDTLKDYCIIQDYSSDKNNLPIFKKKLTNTKINAIRKLKNNSKTPSYDIEGEYNSNQISLKILRSNTFNNFLIYSLIVFFKIKRFFGNLRRKIKN